MGSADKFYTELDRLYSEGDFSKVEKFLKDTIVECDSCCCGIDPLHPIACNELGSLYRGAGLQNEAIQAFTNAKILIAGTAGANSEQMATVLMNLAGAYRLKGEFANALAAFEEAKELYEKTSGRSSYYYAAVLNNIGLLYIDSGERAKAKAAFEEACEIVGGRAELLQEKAISLTNLASLELESENCQKAEEYVSEAVAIYDTLGEAEKVHSAAVFNTLGNIRARGENWSAAAEAFEKARHVTLHYFGKNHEYAISCCSLAEVCLRLGDKLRAAESIDEAMETMEKLGMRASGLYSAAAELKAKLES